MSNAFSNRIGVTIEEGIANALFLNSGISTRNIGLLTERIRGVAGLPVNMTSLKEDVKIFGGHNRNMYSSYVVENLFTNSGGYPVNIYQSRVVGVGSIASKIELAQNAGTPTTVVTSTTQNASASQPQTQKINLNAIAIDETVRITISVGGATPTNAMQEFTRVAGANGLANVINAVKDWATGLSIAGGFVVSTDVDGSVLITSSANNLPFSVTLVNPESASEAILIFHAGMQGSKDVGVWGNELRVRVYPVGDPNGSEDGYFTQVFYQGYLVESFTSVGADFINLADQINQRSGFVMAELGNPALELTTTFDAGLAGGVYNSPTEADFTPRYDPVTEEALGMAVFDSVDVQIIACPEVFSTNFARQCEDFARTNLKHFVFTMPYLATEAVLEQYYNTLATPDQSFASGYLEWVEVPADKIGNKIWIPQTGYILGAGYIRKAGLYNGDVWTPPAGVETNSRGIFRFTHQDLNDDKMSRFVKKWRCNVSKYIKNVGFCAWSSRTYSNNSLFESIHVRLETNWLVRSIEARNTKFMQRLLSPSLEKTIKTDNLVWFKNLYEKGGIEQSIAFSDAVVIDIEISKEDRKEAEMVIAWIPPECLEHLHIRVNRNDGVLVTNF